MDDSARRPRAAIVVTGSELLTGAISDRNGPWLARELGELGFEVAHLMVVGDRRADVVAALGFATAAGCALVVTSGGLGPTADDLTAEVVAAFAGVDLVLDEAMREHFGSILATRAARSGGDGSALEAGNRKQATAPRGAVVLAPAGTAPGLLVDRPGGQLVIALPGPPRELQAMWPAALDASPVRELLSGVPKAVSRELTVRHAKHLVSADGTTTDELVARAVVGRGWTVATAESCTGGLLVARLVDRPGSSAYVVGGTVAYSNSAKVAQLDVPAALIATHGAVSPEVARAMADGARARFGADVGIGITGVAGPGGGTVAKPVGYVCFCVTTGDGVVLARDPVLPGGRADIRERSVTVATHLLLRVARTSS